MVLNADEARALADEVLTFIEQREAEQVAYGIYDVTMTGADVMDSFQPSEDIPLLPAERVEALNNALKQLAADLDIIRFDREESPPRWVFRSRIAETVRLLSKLRQRIVTEDNRKPGHRISNSKRLVADVKFSVATRRVPRRDIEVEDCMAPLMNGSGEQEQVARILLEVIGTALPKLQMMSGFQRRTLQTVLQAIELDQQTHIERGVVVTASTGAGKTYAFFLPVLAKIVLERCLRGREGVKAICIYPRVALSENQLTDFIEVLFHLNQVLDSRGLPPVSVGLESGAAVYESRDFTNTEQKQRESLSKMRGWTFSEEYQGYLSPFAYCVGTEGRNCKKAQQRLLTRPTHPQTLVCPACEKQYPFIKFARDVMEERPPDLLIATTESLHKRLISSKYQYLFGTARFCAPSVVMLDEIHLQTSTAGTQVALLLRRLLARIRLGKRERNERGNLAFVGLSATIAQPVQFLSELSGIPVTRITEVKPQDDEMQTIGAERFIFVRAEENEDTAVISTLIQTAMCVLHTMPQPDPASGLTRYRTFGFVESLDIVGRWLYQMEDAEKVREEQRRRRKSYGKTPIKDRPIRDVPLYAYRFPPFNRQLFDNFLGPNTNCACNCESNGPVLNCPFFQAGECWWVLSQKGKAGQKPLNITRKSGSDRAKPIEDSDDLVITTSALEVGYDDEALMCVLQYTAPANVASFVQRKGRGGRKVGTRPIVVTVLSPYKSTDIFLFRNEHLLTEPTFKKLPLNAQNRYLQRIHGFYTLFDWLAYRASGAGIELDLESLSRQGYNYLMEQTADLGVLLEFKDYLQATFAIPEDALVQVLTKESEGLLSRIFYEGLMKKVHPRFDRENKSFVNARELLRQYLPENLFSDINLPEVQVDYRPDDSRANKRVPSESISQALSETIPGNVSFRGGEGSTWIPPEIADGETALIPIRRYYKFGPSDKLVDVVDTVILPKRARTLVGITPRSTDALELYRPIGINPVRFSSDLNSSFWYCNPETGELRHHQTAQEAGQDMRQLAHGSAAYPISAVDIKPKQRKDILAYTFKPDHRSIASDRLSQELVERIVLYSDEPKNLNLLDVRRIILGSQYTLKLYNSSAEEIRGVVGFKLDEDSINNCALGYRVITEGISFDLKPHAVTGLNLSDSTKANLCFNAIQHAFITKLTVEYQENFFAAENLVEVLLTLADSWCCEKKGTPEGLRDWFSIGHQRFESWFDRAVNEVHQLSRKKREAVWKLVRNDNNYLSLFVDLYADVHRQGETYQQYLRDSFQYSVTLALKQVAQEVAGVEALNYVAAWTELQADFEECEPKRIWLYEIGMGGIGVMRATHDLLRNSSDRFWANLAHKMTRCPTTQEEGFLRHLLSQPPEWLSKCERLVENVTGTASSAVRQSAIKALLAEVRRQLGVLVRQEQLKTLLRVFIPDYTQEIEGSPLVNWRIFREINQEFLPRCAQKFGRDPSFAEAKALLYREINRAIQAKQPSPYPELERLLRLYQMEYSQEPNEVRKAFEAAVERRMLLNCRCNCPSCLDDRSGDIEAPGMSRNLLNRPLLTEWVTQTRSSQTLPVNETGDPAGLCERMRTLLENGSQAIYLRVESHRLASLCATISYLTDAGIDTDSGMVYPMITDIKTIYSNDLTQNQRPLIEVTVRPIE